MNFSELIRYGFMQRALIAGALIATLCAVLGVFLVLRRFSLIGDGLAHVTFGSVAVALLVRVEPAYTAVAAIPPPLSVISCSISDPSVLTKDFQVLKKLREPSATLMRGSP